MLNDTPHDVLIRIMSHTSVLDIIALRQVCKSLLTASYQRVLWIEALQELSTQRNIFLSSFPIPEMTLPQLEHATTAGLRFLARMRRSFKTCPTSVTIRPLSTRFLSSLDSPTESFKNIVLVPGGRFLITSCGKNVRLWDLGFHCGSVLNPFPIASIDIGHAYIARIAITQSSANRQEILVLVISRESPVAGYLNVYRLCPSAEHIEFSLLAVAPVADGFPNLKLFSERHIGVTDNDYILLWNFIEDTWVRWKIFEVPADIHQISICNGNMVVLVSDEQSGEIRLIDFYPLPPRQTGPPGYATIGSVLRVATEPNSFAACTRFTPSFNGAETVGESTVHFDVKHHRLDVDEIAMAHYVLRPVENSGKDGMPGCLPVVVGMTRSLGIGRDTTLSSCLHWINEETIQISWATSEYIATNISGSYPRTKAELPGEPISGVLHVGAKMANGEFGLCPFSGRLCIRTRAADGYEARILDYLAPS
ncbi:hypothetical protein DFH09DRAFT_1143126 [Mycena vulgaris]|nr:hypothetical protein DFH09DRAFT_1143126 [Mycena vulgaris]